MGKQKLRWKVFVVPEQQGAFRYNNFECSGDAQQDSYCYVVWVTDKGLDAFCVSMKKADSGDRRRSIHVSHVLCLVAVQKRCF